MPSRQATLHACLNSAHSFLATLFSIPVMDYYKPTYITWMQQIHVFVVLSKLSSFESDDWDLAHVRDMVDLSVVTDRFVARLEELGRGRSTVNEKNLLSNAILKLKEYGKRFERRREALMRGKTAAEQSLAERAPDVEGGGFLEDAVWFSELDDSFWQEILGDWNSLDVLETAQLTAAA